MYYQHHRLLPLSHNFCSKLVAVIACLFFGVTVAAQEPSPDVRPLAVGERVERKVVGQVLHAYTVNLRRGQVLRASIAEKGADVGAAVVRTTDNQTMSTAADLGNGFMREALTFIAEQDGAYALVVFALQVTDANVGSKYELVTLLNKAATIKDRQRVQAEKLLKEGMQLFANAEPRNNLLALAKWQESLRLWRQLGERYWAEMAAASVGVAHIKSENFGAAIPQLEAALEFFEREKYEPEAGAIYRNLGALYSKILDREKAAAYLNKALRISRNLGDKRSETEILGAMSSVGLDETKNSADFDTKISEARARKDKSAEVEVWAEVISRYALDDSIDVEVRRAFFDKAAREAIPLARESRQSESLMPMLIGLGLGYGYTAMNADDKAQAEADAAKSLDYFAQTLLLSEATNSKQMQADTYVGLNLFYFYPGKNRRLGILLGKKGINLFQDVRQNLKSVEKEVQQNYVKRIEVGYGQLAQGLFLMGRLAEAHQMINFSRDQEYFDFTQNRIQPAAGLSLTAREAENNQLLDREVARITAKYGTRFETDYPQATEELKAVFRQLENNFKVPASERDISRNVPDTTDMQAALHELDAKSGVKHAAIYFVTDIDEILLLTSDSIRAFGAEPGSVALNNPPSTPPQEDAAAGIVNERFGESLGSGTDEQVLKFLAVLSSPTSDPRPLGASLYGRIFKTRELVNGKATGTTLEAAVERLNTGILLWSLSGNIRYVPMAALYDPEKKQYLVEKDQNAVFTRARKERFLIEPRAWARGVGFGAAAARGSVPLPGVTKELSTIFGNATTREKGLFRGRVFLDAAFTRQALLTATRDKPSLIHIASHFSFQPGDSRNSFLLLGDGDKFSLYDMQQYPTLFEGVDLLTLSACETAAQQSGANGKEIDGFVELAQRLGASSVIATLWEVADEGSSQLMTEFYRLRQAHPTAPKSAVLRQAQLNLLHGGSFASEGQTKRGPRGAEIVGTEDKGKATFVAPPNAPFAHPYYWAAFVLFGSTK